MYAFCDNVLSNFRLYRTIVLLKYAVITKAIASPESLFRRQALRSMEVVYRLCRIRRSPPAASALL